MVPGISTVQGSPRTEVGWLAAADTATETIAIGCCRGREQIGHVWHLV